MTLKDQVWTALHWLCDGSNSTIIWLMSIYDHQAFEIHCEHGQDPWWEMDDKYKLKKKKNLKAIKKGVECLCWNWINPPVYVWAYLPNFTKTTVCILHSLYKVCTLKNKEKTLCTHARIHTHTNYTNFLASKKLLRCLICQKPMATRISVWTMDHHSTLWLVLSLVWRKRSSRYCMGRTGQTSNSHSDVPREMKRECLLIHYLTFFNYTSMLCESTNV